MSDAPTKICSKCKISKPLLEFYKDNSSKDHLTTHCKKCNARLGKLRRERNRSRSTITIPPTKTCPGCKTERPSLFFTKNNLNKDGLNGYCKSCSTKLTKIYVKKNCLRDHVQVPPTKTCPGCKTEKQNSSFDRDNGVKDGLQSRCKACHAIDQRKSKYGVTEKQYRTILAFQGGACAICKFIPGPKDKPLYVDHDHTTNENRGLLCHKCNTAIGLLQDSQENINSALIYIQKYTKQPIIVSQIPPSLEGSSQVALEDLRDQDKDCEPNSAPDRVDVTSA
jgi:hypothetical protein